MSGLPEDDLALVLQRLLRGAATQQDLYAIQEAIDAGRLALLAGDIVAGDKVAGDKIAGDKIAGDKVLGDKVSLTLTAEALAQLRQAMYSPAQLPSPDDPPPPASTLPPGSRLPFGRNDAFTGRQAALKVLANDLLFAPSAAPAAITQPVAISGSGGIGKTQLAVEFCYRYGQFFYGVHWLQADQDFNTQVALCGQEMNLQPWPADNLPRQVAATLAAWERQPQRLLVLDNLADPAILADWLPQLNPFKLLITSRSSKFAKNFGVRSHPLELLERAESIELLRKLAPRLQSDPNSELDPIANRLSDFPLALHLAGTYLEYVEVATPKSYLKRLDAPGAALNQDFVQAWKIPTLPITSATPARPTC